MVYRMNVSRRRFVAASGGALVFSKKIEAAAVSEQHGGFAAWMDTLYPADNISPAASDLGVHLQIKEKAVSVRNYTELLKRGMAWADAEAPALGAKSFADLDESGREKIVSTAEAMEETSVPGLFFFHTLRDGAHFYYGHRESWTVVGFPRPPQPVGFPDFAVPPVE